MGKKVEPREKIVQRSVGYRFRQIEGLNKITEKYPNFKPDKFARESLDDQFAELAPEFLSTEDPRHPNNEVKNEEESN